MASHDSISLSLSLVISSHVHGCNLYIVDGMPFTWIEKCKRVLGSVFHFDEQPIMVPIVVQFVQHNV